MSRQVFVLGLLFYSCVSPLIDEQIYSVPPELEYYYDSFIQDGKKHGFDYSSTDVVIQFVEFEGGLAGKHADRYDDIRHIQIDYDIYKLNENDTSVVKWLLYHEFGHALLRLDHKESCNSIMHPYFMFCSTQNFKENEEDMIDQLFLSR